MAEKWIQGAIKHPGALHRELHVPEGEKIPAKKLAKAAHSDNPTLARRANLAKTLGKMHHGQPHPKTNPGPYNDEAHKGAGKAQKLLPPAVGTGAGRPTPHTEPIPHQGRGADKGGYDKDAHTMRHHGDDGRAMGKRGDTEPMHYTQATHAEGATSQPVAGHGGLEGHSGVGMADHHVGHDGHGGAPHMYPRSSGSGGHSFGHPAHLRRGALRMSGHSGAHRIGGGKK